MLNPKGTDFLFVLNLLEDPMDSTGIFFFFNEVGGHGLRRAAISILSYFSVGFRGEGTGRNALYPQFPDTQCPSLQL